MKELISLVLMVASLYAGTKALQEIHQMIRGLALEKASQGLPSLTQMNEAIHRKHSGTKARELKRGRSPR